jgi:putative membrane protein
MLINRLAAMTAALAVLPLAASPALSQPKDAPPPSMQEATQKAPAYLAMAGSSDQYEINSSREVMSAARNPDVRRFAEMMTTDHAGTTKTLMTAAKSAGVTPPPPALLPKHAGQLNALKGAAAPAKERLYVQQQVKAAMRRRATRPRSRPPPHPPCRSSKGT